VCSSVAGTLCNCDVQLVASKDQYADAASCAVDVVSGDVDVLLLLKGSVDIAAELTKLQKQRTVIITNKVCTRGCGRGLSCQVFVC